MGPTRTVVESFGWKIILFQLLQKKGNFMGQKVLAKKFWNQLLPINSLQVVKITHCQWIPTLKTLSNSMSQSSAELSEDHRGPRLLLQKICNLMILKVKERYYDYFLIQAFVHESQGVVNILLVNRV
jgi:hypothetical protein